MINTLPGPNGRSAGSVTWGGIFNTYYWLDPHKRIAGVFLSQLLPFADRNAVALFGEFERGIYGELKAAQAQPGSIGAQLVAHPHGWLTHPSSAMTRSAPLRVR